MDNRRVKFCLKILSRFRKITENLRGVKFFGAPCICTQDETKITLIASRAHLSETLARLSSVRGVFGSYSGLRR